MKNIIIATLLLVSVSAYAQDPEVFKPRENATTFEVPIQPPEMRPGYALQGKGLHSAVPFGRPSADCVINPVSLRRAFTEIKTTKLVAGQIVEIPVNVLFDFDKDFIRPIGNAALNNFYDALLANEVESIDIIGHTDSKGSDEYNLDLGMRRATAVAMALINFGFDAGNIEINTAGEFEPKVPNAFPDGTDDPDGRQTNRRVEIQITKMYDREVESTEIVQVDKNPQIFHVLGSNNSVACIGTLPQIGINVGGGTNNFSKGGVVITVPQ